LLGRFREASVRAVEDLSGFVARHQGDGFLAYFGFPQADEHDAERAVHAGLAVARVVASLSRADGPSLRVRVGIATGRAVVGDVLEGGGTRELAALGPTPNLAARLQGAAEPGRVLISAATAQVVAGRFELAPLDLHLKGVGEHVQGFVVIGPRASASVGLAFARDSLTPLVGRDAELALLLTRWKHATEGEGQVVLLGGEPGIGKSRLAAEFRSQIGKVGRRNLVLQGGALFCDRALYPVALALEQDFRECCGSRVALTLSQVALYLDQLGLNGDDLAPWLAPLLACGTAPERR